MSRVPRDQPARVSQAGPSAGRAPAPNSAGNIDADGWMRFVIPSDLDRGREVQDVILAACREANFLEDAFFAIKLALDEAVTNAIKHGNALDPKKNVEVLARVTPEKLEVQISDEGPGFEPGCVPDPTLDENLDKTSGRGLLLIEAYMSKVEWSADGRTIRMMRRNTDEPPSRGSH